MQSVKKLLVPTDFSPGSEAAGALAARLAQQLGASCDVLTVVDTAPLTDAYGDPTFRNERIEAIRGEARAQAEQFARRHFADGAARVHVRDGVTAPEILAAIRDLDSDLVIMGTHGRTGLAHVLLGSACEKVVRQSPVPVLTTRAPA